MYKSIIIILLLLTLPISVYGHDTTNHDLNIDVDPLSHVEVRTGTTTHTYIDALSGNLISQLNPAFIITTTQSSIDLIMFAHCVDSQNVQREAFVQRSGIQYVTLANLGNINPLDRATNTAIRNSQRRSPNADNNPNAIAYQITTTIDNGGSWTFNRGLQEFQLEANNGTSILSVVLDQVARNDTFSEVDNKGDYQAVIYLEVVAP